MRSSNLHSERGVTVIIVALALMALTVFTGIVVDSGIMWAAREQAQNAADAAALAGSYARIYTDMSPTPSTVSGAVFDHATQIAAQNPIWGVAPPSSSVALDWTCPDTTTTCVVADVYRDGTHGSETLPTTLMRLVNITSQSARAHAVAKNVPANSTDCLRPFYLVDVGYTLGNLPVGATISFSTGFAPFFGIVDTGPGTPFQEMLSCATGFHHVSETFPTIALTDPSMGSGIPDAVTNIVSTLTEIIGWDPTANWDPVTTNIVASCAPNCSCPGFTCPNAGTGMSPRVFILPVCNPSEATCMAPTPGGATVTTTTFVPVFIDSTTVIVAGPNVTLTISGHVVRAVGQIDSTKPPAPVDAAFLETPILIR